MSEIAVPKTPKSAFNKKRPISSLLAAQITHMEHATRSYGDRHKPPKALKRIRTEAQAAEYLAKLTAFLRRRPAPIRVVEVPKTPKTAFNKNRPVSSLLRSQIEHMEHATRPRHERHHPSKVARTIRTEGQAAEYLGELTRVLHQHDSKEPVPSPERAAARPSTGTTRSLAGTTARPRARSKSIRRRRKTR